jgi:hypothetical protein
VHTFLACGGAINPGMCPLRTFLVGLPFWRPAAWDWQPCARLQSVCVNSVQFLFLVIPCMLCLYLVWYMRLPSWGPRGFGRLHTALTVVTVVSLLAMIEVPLTGVLEKYDVLDVIMKW